MTVLRDGQTIATRNVGEVDRAGADPPDGGPRGLRHLSQARRAVWATWSSKLAVWRSRAAGIRDVSLAVRSGEILGLAGLVGSGRTELAETLFGLTPADGGEILLRGQAVRIVSPADAIALGIGYVPEDRRQHGVVLEMPIAANTSLASLDAVSRHGMIDAARERRLARGYVERLRIKTGSHLRRDRLALRRQSAEGGAGPLAGDPSRRC